MFTITTPDATHSFPSQPKSLIDYYKAIEGASRQMLEAAQREEWDQVVRLEGACAVLIEQLRSESRKQALPNTARAEKQRIMLSILRHDAAIRQLAEPWLTDIDNLLNGQQPRQLH